MLKTSQQKMPNEGKQTCEAHEEADKHVIKQKGVSQEDKCRFGLSVHSSIGLEYERHTDLCMNMQASMQKNAYKQGEPNGWHKQARQAYQHHTEWRKVCIKHTNTIGV